MNTETKVPRKIFQVMIRDKYYDVYDIDGKEHRGDNGEPKTWWLYYAEQLPEGTIPPAESEDFVPWHKWILRQVWEVTFKDYNSTKYKWDEVRFSNGCICEMKCNGKPVYSFRCGKMELAFAKAQYLQTILSEHPYNFFDPEQEKGRKIWFYNLPATVQPSSYYPGEIKIHPDYSEIDQTTWWKLYKERSIPNKQSKEDEEWENDLFEETQSSGYINWGDALSDGHINWFRK